jgi:hypothetical protein
MHKKVLKMVDETIFSTFRIKTEQANEIARLIRQYITIDQKSREVGANQVSNICNINF